MSTTIRYIIDLDIHHTPGDSTTLLRRLLKWLWRGNRAKCLRVDVQDLDGEGRADETPGGGQCALEYVQGSFSDTAYRG